MPVTVKTYGSAVLKELNAAFEKGVNASGKGVYNEWQKNIKVDTGASKASMKVINARRDGDEMYSIIAVETDYAIHPELEDKAGRRSLAAAGKSSLKNFKGLV